MILTILALFLPFIILFLFDLELFLATSVFFNALVILYRLYKREEVALNIILLCVYTFLLLYQSFSNIEMIIPYTGVFVYSALICYFLFRLVRAVLNLDSSESKEKHVEIMIGDVTLIISNVLSIILTFVLFPNITYIIIPCVLSISSALLSIFISKYIFDLFSFILFVIKYPHEMLKVSKNIFGNYHGWFRFNEDIITKEVITGKDLELFYQILSKGFLAIYNNSEKTVNFDDLMIEIKKETKLYMLNSSIFISYNLKTHTPLGCIRVVNGTLAKGLPFYNCTSARLEAKYVSDSVEFGRLAVITDGLLRGKVLQELLSMAFTKSIVDKKYFILVSAVEYNMPLYSKLGIIQISDSIFDEELKLDTIIAGELTSTLVKYMTSSLWKSEYEKSNNNKWLSRFLNASKKHSDISIKEIMENNGGI